MANISEVLSQWLYGDIVSIIAAYAKIRTTIDEYPMSPRLRTSDYSGMFDLRFMEFSIGKSIEADGNGRCILHWSLLRKYHILLDSTTTIIDICICSVVNGALSWSASRITVAEFPIGRPSGINFDISQDNPLSTLTAIPTYLDVNDIITHIPIVCKLIYWCASKYGDVMIIYLLFSYGVYLSYIATECNDIDDREAMLQFIWQRLDMCHI